MLSIHILQFPPFRCGYITQNIYRIGVSCFLYVQQPFLYQCTRNMKLSHLYSNIFQKDNNIGKLFANTYKVFHPFLLYNIGRDNNFINIITERK